MDNIYDWDEDPDEDPCIDCPYYDLSGDICKRTVQGKNCFYIDESIRILKGIKEIMEVGKGWQKD